MVMPSVIEAYPGLTPQVSGPKRFRSLLIADDDSQYRQGLRAFLELSRQSSSAWFQQIYEASSSSDCINMAIAHRPDLILLDLEFLDEEVSGLEIFEKLKAVSYPGKIAIISGHSSAGEIFKAIKLGACGYLLKDQLVAHLPAALSAWVENRVYLGTEAATRFFQVFQSKYGGRTALIEPLTPRENEVLQLLVEGASNQSIAKRLYVTTATVKAHLTAIFNKLQVTSRTQALIKAVKLGLVRLDEE
ncbi:MAG: response regulator transcription factor [Cyanobacteria bacterium P01_C01_bin.73]